MCERHLQAWPSPFTEASEQRACQGCHDAAITPKAVMLPGNLPSNAAAAPSPMASGFRPIAG